MVGQVTAAPLLAAPLPALGTERAPAPVAPEPPPVTVQRDSVAISPEAKTLLEAENGPAPDD